MVPELNFIIQGTITSLMTSYELLNRSEAQIGIYKDLITFALSAIYTDISIAQLQLNYCVIAIRENGIEKFIKWVVKGTSNTLAEWHR